MCILQKIPFMVFLMLITISSSLSARHKDDESQKQNQNTTVQLISNTNISKDLIKSIFEGAYSDIKINEKGDMIVNDSWPIYIDLDDQKRYVTFSVYWQVNDTATDEKKLELLNTLSSGILCISSHFDETGKTIAIKYDLWVEGGITYKNLIAAEKIFVKCLSLALDKDVNRVIK
jgi:hypothetical protein